VVVAGGATSADRVQAALSELGRRNITSLFLEGGRTLAAAFTAAGQVDEARVLVAPVLLGGGERLSALDSDADTLITARFKEW
jgi:diaminohydroxyphosphoribosylaminopyrimidine deaminase/5-amino-6-(5-phosphoribosylamino)uracil reductase